MTVGQLQRHIIWSTDQLDLSDPFQRRWYLRQVLSYGLTEDIRALDLEDVKSELENLDLPSAVYALWKSYLKIDHVNR